MKHTGSCHCKKVLFTCEFTLQQPTMCNCSYCHKRNAVLHIVDTLEVLQGKDNLTCYRFNKLKGEHNFCKDCGVFIYSRPPEPVYPFAISLCVLDECDWSKLPLNHFDGKAL